MNCFLIFDLDPELEEVDDDVDDDDDGDDDDDDELGETSLF